MCTFPDVRYNSESKTESRSASAPSTNIRNTGCREDPGRSISENNAGIAESPFATCVCSLLDILLSRARFDCGGLLATNKLFEMPKVCRLISGFPDRI